MMGPIARGSALAILAAVLFGATTPLVKHFGASVGAFATAALLYGGATLGAGLPRRRADEPPVARSHAPRILAIAACGAALAPASLAWGLQHAGAMEGSLLLNLEAVFTVLLARALYGELIGRRVALAVTLMVAGGAVLALRAGDARGSSAWGVAAIAAATFGWALDNTLTRPLADLDPRAVVFWKALVGSLLSFAVALATVERWPTAVPLLALLACGAIGYGLSLRAYLHAQRVLGAGRTGSLFAIAPFVGVVIAFTFGERESLALITTAGVLFSLAVVLHVTEAHGHRHAHRPTSHEHAHRHDDGHHTHVHEPPITGSHSHPHAHERAEHDHPHGADLHHRHEHDI